MISNFTKRAWLLNLVEMLRGHLNLDENRQQEIVEKVLQYFTSARDCELFLEGRLTVNNIGKSEIALENLTDVYRFMRQNMPEEKGANSFLNEYITKLRGIDKATVKEKKDLSEFLWSYRKSIPDIKPDVDIYGATAA